MIVSVHHRQLDVELIADSLTLFAVLRTGSSSHVERGDLVVEFIGLVPAGSDRYRVVERQIDAELILERICCQVKGKGKQKS